MILSCFFFMALRSPCPLGRRSSKDRTISAEPQLVDTVRLSVCLWYFFLEGLRQNHTALWKTVPGKLSQRLDTFIYRFSFKESLIFCYIFVS